MEHKKLAIYLGYSGLIPFYSINILYFYLGRIEYLIEVYLLYSLVILSFLCGTQWSKILNTETINNKNFILVLSVGLPIVGFFLDFIQNQDIKLLLYIFGFFTVNQIDKNLFFEKNNYWYLTFRKRLTFLVIISQIINLFAIYSHRFF